MEQQPYDPKSLDTRDRSFEQLVTLYQHELYAYALRLTRHPQDAEDIFQETIMRAYIAMKSYSLRQVQILKPRPWLYKIMTNIFLNSTRTQKPLSMPFTITESEDNPLLSLEGDWYDRPDVVVETAEQLSQLSKLVDILPGRFRAAILLHCFQGFTYNEIASMLAQPLNTVKANISHGKQLLQQAVLQQQDAEREIDARS